MEQDKLKRHYLTLPEFLGSNSRLSSQQVNLFQKKLIEDSFQRERTIQLINEEIILEVTAEMSEEIASQVLHAFTLASQMSLEQLMTCVTQEGKANNDPKIKVKLTPFWHRYKSERDQNRNKAWSHSQKLTRHKPLNDV